MSESSDNKTIAFVHGGTFPCGGAERVTMDVARELHASGRHVVIICEKIEDSLIPQDFPINIIKLNCRNRDKKSIDEYAKIITTHGISIMIFVCFMQNNVKALKQMGVKIIHANHSMPFWEGISKNERRSRLQKGNLWQRLRWHFYYKRRCHENGVYIKRCHDKYRHIINSVDAYTVLCQGYKQDITRQLHLSAEQQDKIHVIGNYEAVVEHPTLDKEKLVIFVGRLTYEDKRVDRLLHIWHEVEKTDHEWQLLIVGDGCERPKLERLAAQLHLRRVSFEGKTANTADYYRRAAILCMTSTYEGWGLVLTEAQAHGVVPVAFNCGAGVETILSPSGTNGILIQPFDLKAYAQALSELIHSPEKRKVIQQNIVKLRYSKEETCQKYKQLITSLARS